MRTLVLLLILLSLPALGCMGPVSAEKVRGDIERQAQVTEDLAKSADRVFIGELVSVSASRTSGRFRVLEHIKGEVSDRELRLRLKDDARTVVACRAWRMFRNVHLYQGETYIVYSTNGELLRTGLTERIHWDIGLDREISIVRRVAGNT